MYYILNIVLGKELSFSTVLNMGCLIFLPGDVLKLVVASLIAIKTLPLIKTMDN